MVTPSRRFRVAFSFAGEKQILYDEYHSGEFARADLGIYLPDLYQ